MITTNLVLKNIFIFIAALCLMLLSIDKEHHILNTKMKTIINVLVISVVVYVLCILLEKILKISE